jgi:uncharacterized protein YfbU (UPF0304 family)
MTKLPPPTGTMTVTYELDRRVKVPMWDEHARAVDVWHVRDLIKGEA